MYSGRLVIDLLKIAQCISHQKLEPSSASDHGIDITLNGYSKSDSGLQLSIICFIRDNKYDSYISKRPFLFKYSKLF